ncbi:MAG: NUDIX hydrolase [Hyphomicrobiaceae bacterium]
MPVQVIVPRPAASACVFRGDAVLLVQRGKPPYLGSWNLPGGSIALGETAIDAAAREVLEETGITCRLHAVAGVNDVILRDSEGVLTHHYVIAAFAGSGEGEPVAGSDAMAAEFIAVDQIAERGLGARICQIVMTAYRLDLAQRRG